MDLKTVMQGMTFWNWLSLCLVLPAILGGLNATLSLKSRYLDWRGIQSKKQFVHRLAQLKVELAQIETHKKNLPAFLVHLSATAIPALGLFFGAVILFIGAFTIFRIPLSNFLVFEFLYLAIALLFGILAGERWKRLARMVEIVNSPIKFGLELIDFIYTGRQKGFIVGGENFILSLMKNSDIFTDDERAQLFSRSFDLDRGSINDYGTEPVHRDNGA
jgi:hypothetical protein